MELFSITQLKNSILITIYSLYLLEYRIGEEKNNGLYV